MFICLREENPQGVISGDNSGSGLLYLGIDREPGKFDGHSAVVFGFCFFLKNRRNCQAQS